MTITDLKSQNLLLFEALTGSRAYGTDLPTSDHDIRGIFILPKKQFYGLTDLPQIADERNDIVYYELHRFFDLLAKNNPNMLELLAMPEDCILFKHPLFEKIKPELFLSKICRHTFAGYALAQIQKARGLNKKIVNPVAKERKSILDFCYVVEGQGSVPLQHWLTARGFVQERCGLVNIPHFRDTYALFYDVTGTIGYRGILHKPTSNEVALSSIPKGKTPDGILSFNLDGYQVYCKDYREYWEWVEKRNPARYEGTISHGKNYDAKNMMHTFRLLDMAEEIARYGKIQVRRHNRDILLKIRAGEFEYDDLLQQAEERIENIHVLFEASDLPEKPDFERLENILVEIREAYYYQVI
ncbi:MAG: nucleotidyltransferase domain-containing protein [Bacteroidota bacterium]